MYGTLNTAMEYCMYMYMYEVISGMLHAVDLARKVRRYEVLFFVLSDRFCQNDQRRKARPPETF
jgi:hypothetical protein